MFNNFLTGLRFANGNNTHDDKRRKSPRRESDRCVAVVYGQTFPVENWSFGGLLLSADERLFGADQDIEIGLKFKLRNTIVDIVQRGHVARKASGKVAIRFEPLEKAIRRSFQQVVDDAVASEFAHSQI